MESGAFDDDLVECGGAPPKGRRQEPPDQVCGKLGGIGKDAGIRGETMRRGCGPRKSKLAVSVSPVWLMGCKQTLVGAGFPDSVEPIMYPMPPAATVGLAESSTSVSIADQVDRWIQSLETQVPLESERKKYRFELDRAAQFCGWSSASDATRSDIEDFLAKRREGVHGGKKIRGKTYNGILSKIRAFFEYAKSHKWVKENPAEGIAWASQNDSEDGSRAFTDDEVSKMLSYAGTPDPHDRRKTVDRFFVYVIAASTPLRRLSIAKLTWRMFVIENEHERRGCLVIPRRAVKKSQRTHRIPLPPMAVASLLDWFERSKRPAPDAKIFPRMPEHRTIRNDATNCGIPLETVEGRIGYNSFRKAYLTTLAGKMTPAVLNQVSGHKDIRTTLKHYVGQLTNESRAVIEKLPDFSPTGVIRPISEGARNHPTPNKQGSWAKSDNAPLTNRGSDADDDVADSLETVVRHTPPQSASIPAHSQGGLSATFSKKERGSMKITTPEMTPMGFEPMSLP